MADLTIHVGGKCSKCGHPQQTHEDNTGCSYPMPEKGEGTACGCESIGSY